MIHFGNVAAEHLGWPLIVDAPTGDVDNVYIIGMYDPPYYRRTLAMTARAKHRIIQWCGTDTALVDAEYLPEAVHLASDGAYTRRLAANRGPVAKTVLLPNSVFFAEPLPLPEVPTIGCYLGSNAGKYGAEWIQALSEALPDVRLLTWQYGQYTPEELAQVYAQVTVQVQPGLTSAGCTLRECMEAGRKCIGNGLDYHGLLPFHEHDFAGFVRNVRNALKATEPDAELAAYWREANDPALFVAAVEEACR